MNWFDAACIRALPIALLALLTPVITQAQQARAINLPDTLGANFAIADSATATSTSGTITRRPNATGVLTRSVPPHSQITQAQAHMHRAGRKKHQAQPDFDARQGAPERHGIARRVGERAAERCAK